MKGWLWRGGGRPCRRACNQYSPSALAQRVHEACVAHGIRLALAESCTGGYLAHLLTSIPGASNYLSCSIVAYSKEAKTGLLGVESKLIEKHGTISPECALAMATGVAKATGSDAALSVTGNLGPEPMEDKATGLVYIAVYFRGKARVREFRFTGQRGKIKEMASEEALRMLIQELG
ncbi:CinA family protein [Nitrospirota bacterium]